MSYSDFMGCEGTRIVPRCLTTWKRLGSTHSRCWPSESRASAVETYEKRVGLCLLSDDNYQKHYPEGRARDEPAEKQLWPAT